MHNYLFNDDWSH